MESIVRIANNFSDTPYQNISDLRQMIRSVLLIDKSLGNPDAPFTSLIKPGMTVLIKPNWVHDANKSGQTMDCLVTHPNFILAVLQEVVACQPGQIIIGDAPIQSCQFDKLVTPEFRNKASQITNCPFTIKDFRRAIASNETLASGVHSNLQPLSEYVQFDLGKDSLLEPISHPLGRFRVTNYDPRALAIAHQPGKHEYILRREVFETDVIINLPKLKTHKKAGLTAALKNLVGLNGNKDYLPHHRLGGSALGGDCYPGLAPLKRLAEFFFDQANQHINKSSYDTWIKLAHTVTTLQSRLGEIPLNIDGSWYGNDTVWRMALDLNRILLYGQSDGTMASSPQRTIYSLCDGIVAGQGEGPLASTPLLVNVVTFATSSAFADLAHAALLRLNWRDIPIIKHAFDQFPYPITNSKPDQASFILNDQPVDWEVLANQAGRKSIAPIGWRGRIEWEPDKAFPE